jgi:MFS family permease
MCQSAQTSLVAFVVATLIALLVITKGKKNGIWNGFFILAFILIQLLEFFIWWNRRKEGLTDSAEEAKKEGDGPRNKPSGETLTRLILIALWLQPLIQTFMAYKYGQPRFKSQLLVLTMAYFVMFIWSIVRATDSKRSFATHPVTGTCGEGHLVWTGEKPNDPPMSFVGPGPAGLIYGFGLVFGLLFMRPTKFGIMLAVLGGIMLTYVAKNYRTGESSSMWCLFAIFYAFLALIMAYSREKQE